MNEALGGVGARRETRGGPLAIADRLQNSLVALARVQFGVGLAGIFSLWGLANSGGFYEWGMRHIGLASWWHWAGMRFLEAGLIMLPTLLLTGMAFPLAVRAVVVLSEALSTLVGRLYAWNTVGGVLGSLVAGFAIMPLIGTENGLLLAECGDAREAARHLREYLRLAPFAQDAEKVREVLERLQRATQPAR